MASAPGAGSVVAYGNPGVDDVVARYLGVARRKGELDKLTGKYTGTVDEFVRAKEVELLEV
jgi:hypothetical protein